MSKTDTVFFRANPKAHLSPQNKKLLKALESGRTVTRLTALFELRIACITARIGELRAAVYAVMTRMRGDTTAARYADYYLR